MIEESGAIHESVPSFTMLLQLEGGVVKRFLLILMTGVALSLSLPARSRADVIFSNLGAGDSYTAGGLIAARGASVSGGPYGYATAFTVGPGTDFDLSQIEIAATFFGGSNSANVRFYDDLAGGPINQLGSWMLNVPGFGTSTIQPAQTITGITGITLSANAVYWLALLPGDSGSQLVWNSNNTGQANGGFYGLPGAFSNYTNNTDFAYAIFGTPSEVTAVPEASTFVLLAIGLAGLIATSALRKRLEYSGQ